MADALRPVAHFREPVQHLVRIPAVS